MAGQSLGPCRHFSHVSIKLNLFLLCRIVYATSLSAHLFTRVTGVVSLPSDGSLHFWCMNAFATISRIGCPSMLLASTMQTTVSRLQRFTMDGQDDGAVFFLCHSQVNGAKVVWCDDNRNKQRVLMHRHQGWNVRHGLCHIYMRYLYIYELFIAFVCFVVCSSLQRDGIFGVLCRKWQARESTGMFGNLMAIYYIMPQFIQNHSRFVMLMKTCMIS